MRTACLLAALTALFLPVAVSAQSQQADPAFDATVARPAYRDNGPVVAIDEAHRNFHTASGRFAPFAALLRNDGYRIVPSAQPFTAASLAANKVLVIANAGNDPDNPGRDPFTDAEADALVDWVRRGGSLLLVADHAPFGAAANRLAGRFGVAMGQGWVLEPGERPGGVTTQILHSRDNGRLGDHPITRGRGPDEQVRSVRAFTGQSLQLAPATGRSDVVPLMTLGADAREAPDQQALNAAAQALAAGRDASAFAPSVGGRLQGVAMRFGEGRVVVLAEAGMLTAQVVTFPPEMAREPMRFGMNVPGIDNRQFVLNTLRWLSGALN